MSNTKSLAEQFLATKKLILCPNLEATVKAELDDLNKRFEAIYPEGTPKEQMISYHPRTIFDGEHVFPYIVVDQHIPGNAPKEIYRKQLPTGQDPEDYEDEISETIVYEIVAYCLHITPGEEQTALAKGGMVPSMVHAHLAKLENALYPALEKTIQSELDKLNERIAKIFPDHFHENDRLRFRANIKLIDNGLNTETKLHVQMIQSGRPTTTAFDRILPNHNEFSRPLDQEERKMLSEAVDANILLETIIPMCINHLPTEEKNALARHELVHYRPASELFPK